MTALALEIDDQSQSDVAWSKQLGIVGILLVAAKIDKHFGVWMLRLDRTKGYHHTVLQ